MSIGMKKQYKEEEKREGKKQRYAKALMIFRALTACHLHDDNGQL